MDVMKEPTFNMEPYNNNWNTVRLNDSGLFTMDNVQRQSSNISDTGGNAENMMNVFYRGTSQNNNGYPFGSINNNTSYNNVTNYFGVVV